MNDRSEELAALLLEFDELEILEALMQNSIVDRDTGLLTTYWLNFIDPSLSVKAAIRADEDRVLSEFAKLLKKRLK